MKAWWQPSLVRRVLFTLLAAFLLVWCVLIAVDYLDYRKGAHRRTGLEELAKNIAESLPEGETGAAVAVIKATEVQYNRLRKSSTIADVGDLLLRLDKRDGTPLYGPSAAGGLGIPGAAPYPESLTIGGHRYWSTVQESGEWRLQILEPVIDDTLIVRLLGGELLLPMLISFPLVLIPLWFAVRRGLWPLRRLVANIEARAPGNFTPLSLNLKYAELQPLVATFNHLLETSRQGIERERAFVQDAAHELRTPLAAVSAQAHLLLSTNDPAQQDQAGRALERTVQRASHLVHQLLTLAALEGGARRSEQRLDLVGFARDIVIAATPAANTKSIEVVLESSEQLNATLDTSAFHSVLGNLLDNALAYCPAGSLVTIGLKVEQDHGLEGIRLSVTDNGPGVPDEELPRLFERFFRGHGVATSGSGLGLPIVQQAASRMGGSLSVTCGPDGRGLAVSLWMPGRSFDENPWSCQM